jgi:hypothetical protein
MLVIFFKCVVPFRLLDKTWTEFSILDEVVCVPYCCEAKLTSLKLKTRPRTTFWFSPVRYRGVLPEVGTFVERRKSDLKHKQV